MAAPFSKLACKNNSLWTPQKLPLVFSHNKKLSSGYKNNLENKNASTNISRLKPHLYKRLKGILQHPGVETQPRPFPNFKRPSIEFPEQPNRFNNKIYAKFGSASGINPSLLWPPTNVVEREIAKAQLSKPVTERIQILREKKLLEKEEIEQHQKRIVERMSKMDEYIQQHYERRNKQLEKDNKQLERQKALLEEAREFFGYEVSHKDLKFQQMMEWKEEQEKKAKKLLKKQNKANLIAQRVAKLTADMNTQSADGGESTAA